MASLSPLCPGDIGSGAEPQHGSGCYLEKQGGESEAILPMLDRDILKTHLRSDIRIFLDLG